MNNNNNAAAYDNVVDAFICCMTLNRKKHIKKDTKERKNGLMRRLIRLIMSCDNPNDSHK